MNPRSFVLAAGRAIANAIRTTRRRPAFFVVAAPTLAVALGICSATFALVDTIAHPRSPYTAPEHVVLVQQAGGNRGAGGMYAERAAALRRAPQFTDIAASNSGIRMSVQIRDNVEPHGVAHVTPDFFRVLGVRVAKGRDFAVNDDGHAVIISERLWRGRLPGVTIADATVSLDGKIFPVAGVVPNGVQVPRFDVDVWVPMSQAEQAAGASLLIARFAKGVTFDRARDLINAANSAFSAAHAEQRPFTALTASMAPPAIHVGSGQLLMSMFSGFVLLIACANLSAITLARTVTQQRDLALRLALGARTRSLIADQLAEIGIVTVVGGAAGIVVGQCLASLYAHTMPANFVGPAVVFEPYLSVRSVVFALLAVVCAMVIATLIPAAQLRRIAPAGPLKESAGTTTGRSTKTLRDIVFLELALTMLLLVPASFTVRSVQRIAAFTPGFDAEPLRQLGGVLARGDTLAYGAQGVERALLERLRVIPGVIEATPFIISHQRDNDVHSDGTLVTNLPLTRSVRVLGGEGVLHTLGLPVIRGRDFAIGDRDGAGVAILDDNAAKRLFPDSDPIGKRIKLGNATSETAPWVTVVGVTSAAAMVFPTDPDATPTGTVFVSRTQAPPRLWNILVRLDSHVPTARVAVQRMLTATLPATAYGEVTALSSVADADLRAFRFIAWSFGAIAAAAMLLAAVGVFGVVSYAATQRMREFGVRVALGAQRASILSLVLRDGVRLALGGALIGGTGGLAFMIVAGKWIYGVPPTDLVAPARAAATLIAVTMLACAVPAWRATRANPLDVMRAT